MKISTNWGRDELTTYSYSRLLGQSLVCPSTQVNWLVLFSTRENLEELFKIVFTTFLMTFCKVSKFRWFIGSNFYRLSNTKRLSSQFDLYLSTPKKRNGGGAAHFRNFPEIFGKFNNKMYWKRELSNIFCRKSSKIIFLNCLEYGYFFP